MQLGKIQYASPKIPELVMQALIAAIDSNQIRVGEELPSERDLAETLGVGRGSLRECFAILEFLGAIENRGNRKVVMRDADYIQKAISFVRASNQPDIQQDFNEFRLVNEVAIVGLACQRATAEDLASIYQAIEHLEAQPDDYMADVEFHDALAVASHNVMLAATIHLTNSMIADIRRRLFTLGSHEYQQRTQASHRAIYEAVMARNAELAKREMELHLAIVSEFTEKYPDRD